MQLNLLAESLDKREFEGKTSNLDERQLTVDQLRKPCPIGGCS